MKKRSLALSVCGGILFAVGAFAAVSLAGSSDNGSPTTGHITICHHTGDKARPFIVISPDASGVYDGHAGLSHQYGDDIIPAFSYVNAHGETVSFPGQNLTTLYDGVTGATLLANGCVAAPVTTTTVPLTTTTLPLTTTTLPRTTTTAPITTTTVQITTTTVPITTTTVAGATTTTTLAPTTTAAGGVAGTTSALTTTAATTTTATTTTAPLTPPTSKPSTKPKKQPAAKSTSPGAFKPPKAPAANAGGVKAAQATQQPKLAFTP